MPRELCTALSTAASYANDASAEKLASVDRALALRNHAVLLIRALAATSRRHDPAAGCRAAQDGWSGRSCSQLGRGHPEPARLGDQA